MLTQVDKLVKGLAPMIDMIKVLIRILNEVAEFEEVEGKRLDEALNELFNPSQLAEISKHIPPEIFGEFMAAIIKLTATATKIQSFMQLPVDEKRKLASELEGIAVSLEKVIGKLKEQRG